MLVALSLSTVFLYLAAVALGVFDSHPEDIPELCEDCGRYWVLSPSHKCAYCLVTQPDAD